VFDIFVPETYGYGQLAMAERESQSQEGFDWASLPGPALAAVAKALEAKGPLLRTSRLNRDTVLSTSRVVSLTIKHDEKCINVHQPLLRRVCTTARPGIQLELKLKDGGRGGKLWNVGTFLQPFVKKPPLVNVSTLVLKVTKQVSARHSQLVRT
jgi:hypothetical protein